MTQRPTLRSVLLVAVGIPLAVLPSALDERLWGGWLAVALVSVAAMLVDGLRSVPPVRLSHRVSTPLQLAVGAPDDLVVRIAGNELTRALRLEARVDTAGELAPVASIAGELEPGGELVLRAPLVAPRRGTAHVERLWLRWTSPWGLMQTVISVPLARALPVLPDLQAVRATALRFFTSREFLGGSKVQKYIGDGSEFESLREYQPGLDRRAIDWKASARHRVLLSRDFQAERDHHVILAFDTGYLMRAPLAGLPKLDHSINAGLLLSYVALRTGDRVGWYAFAGRPRAYVAPQLGVHSVAVLQRAASSMEYSTEETNFTLAMSDLRLRLRKRSLVVVLTDFVDSVTAELMVDNLARLGRRHLVLFVVLRDAALEARFRAVPTDLLAVHRATAVRALLDEKRQVLARLERFGVRCVHVEPGQVSAGLVNAYLDIKRRERL